MKNKKTIIIVSIYIFIVAVMVVSTLFVIDGIKKYVNDNDELDYVVDDVFDGDIIPVVKNNDNMIIKPYLSDNVSIGKYYYDYNADESKQENSLILYKNTYLQNNGVEYISNEIFDVVSILDGEVIGIEDSEVYGKILTIKNNDNLVSIYSNIDNITVSVGYKVSQGEIIGTSRNSLESDDNNMLHFEVYYKGNTIDPESLYTLKVSDIE